MTMEHGKAIAFYVTLLATLGVALLGPALGGLLPDGPIDIPVDIGNFRLTVISFVDSKELAGGLWFTGLMVGIMTAAALLLSSSEDNFRRLTNRSTQTVPRKFNLLGRS